jgi:hypothetical protein
MSRLQIYRPRQRLSDRRQSATFDFEFASLYYSCTHSSFADGRTGEVFLNNHKHDSAADLWARDAGILVSLALQFGASLDVLRQALGRDSRDQPTSPIGAALDHIAKEAPAKQTSQPTQSNNQTRDSEI